ncbi:DUF2007 domain-containing protein [Bradymonadaceae bacterium TMQ3]|uniref:DUF2007 domain-containing protein n=1 Tax=Lujinxingia sediminis TaxID=2480984 RepID=A0ABY0CR42_9DELT|nr:DUF2007 domain-containing protein [Lujinxingia sediminis]RDV37841.1 DUF2007 domain-containing protein [Bradymonadaceae bacterium TMQ3]RVU42827.1 DUF2007 domain-containing protein [Lujinxingia sediminis]TXC75377.1 DUF2007 domain-containing protein [Bradymonadales bacterium TMQ1]
MRDDTIVIISYASQVDAHIARTRLADAQIPCALEDEGIVAAYGGISSAVGGVKVRVRREDAQRAYALLSDTSDGFLEDSMFVDEDEAALFDGECDAASEEEIEGGARGGVIAKIARLLRGG